MDSSNFDTISLELKKRAEEHAKDIYQKLQDDIEFWFYDDWESNFKTYVENEAIKLVRSILAGNKLLTDIMPMMAFDDFWERALKNSENQVIKELRERVKFLEEDNILLRRKI